MMQSNMMWLLALWCILGLLFFKYDIHSQSNSPTPKTIDEGTSTQEQQNIAELSQKEQIKILLNDPKPMKRRAAAIALAEKRTEVVFFSLISALNDKDKLVQKNVIRALGKQKNKLACPHLLITLEASDLDIKNESIRSFGFMQQYCPGLRWKLEKYLNHENTTIQISSIWAITKLKIKESLGILIEKLFDEKKEIRAYVAQKIVEFREPKSIPFLKKVYQEDKDLHVRQSAAIALRQLGENVDLPISSP